MIKTLTSQRRRWFCLIVILLSQCSLQCKAADNDAELSLKNAWDIIGPNGKKCLAKSDAKDAPSDSNGTNSTVCEDSSSAIRMEYKIHKNAKYPKYQLFRKECKERFETGEEPIQGTASPDEDDTIPLSLSPESDGEDTVTASMEILPNKESFSSSWLQRLTNTEEQQHTVEFCVRMGLWIPPQAGNVEVNFRETNVIMTFNATASDNDDGGDYVVDSFVLNPKELVGIKVNIMGSTSKIVGKGTPSTEKNDEL